MSENSTVRPFDWVELIYVRNAELTRFPLLVTDVFDNDVIHGVAFTGLPGAVGWGRCAQEFNHLPRGDDNRCWSPRADTGSSPEVGAILAAVQDALPEWLPPQLSFTEDGVRTIVENVLAEKTSAPYTVTDLHRAAIRRLDRDDPSQWTATGEPRVEAIEELVGGDLTAAQRDEAWAAEQAAATPQA